MRRFLGAALVVTLALAVSGEARAIAVNPSLNPDDEHPRWEHIFPIWGDQATARGFKLPLPWGVSFGYFGAVQPVDINRIGLGVNEIPPTDVDFIEFSEIESRIDTLNLRLDLWVFPFLNVYGLFVVGQAETAVGLAEPIEFSTAPVQNAVGRGFGVTTAFGFEDFWLSVDANLAWNDLENLDDPARSFVLGVRAGKTVRFLDQDVTVWVGTMRQSIKAATEGSISLADALTGEGASGVLERYEEYVSLLPDGPRKEINETLLSGIGSGERDVVINYDLDKALGAPWNLLVGAQYGINDAWYLRAEVGLVDRRSFLVQINYRFGLFGATWDD